MPKDPNELLTVNEHCREKKISPTTFYRLKKMGFIPDGIPVGLRGRRWTREVIDAALARAGDAGKEAA